MATVLLKNLTDRANILEQQNAIISYAKKHFVSINITEIDTSDSSKILEDRHELKGFLRSLNPNSNLLVYDFWVLSADVSELVKICECLLQRNISLHICNKKEIIESNSSALHVLSILSKERNTQTKVKENTFLGRPKGRMSQSKFDKYRSEIITYLEDGFAVSKIAEILNVRRTSLKDYINSRNLKELANTKKELLGATPKKIARKIKKTTQCDLIAQKSKKDK